MTKTHVSNVTTRVCPAIERYIFNTATVETLSRWFLVAGRTGMEDVAICAGYPTTDGDAIVATVLRPNADRAVGWYEQRDDSTWSELYAFGRPHGMYYLAQLHTHPPGCSTRHSRADDVGAFVDRIGFISIVVPEFARNGVDLLDRRVTVHERTSEGWRVWPHREALRRFSVVPMAVDFQIDQRR